MVIMAQFNQSQIIPDDVLLELQKITKLEQQTQGLSSQTQTLQQQMSQVNTILQENNLIKDDFSNVIDTKNKPKETLSAVEKKRFQIIGQEFIKGAEPFLKQIKKAEQLKQKMSTKVNPFAKKLKDFLRQGAQRLKSKVKSKFGGAMKKFGLAILAIGAVLFLFKDKIGDILDKVKIDQNGSFSKLFKNVDIALDKLETSLSESINNILGGLLSDDFAENVEKFLTVSLPQQIRNIGYETLRLLGADIPTDINKDVDNIEKEDKALHDAAAARPKPIVKKQERQINTALNSQDIQKILKAKEDASKVLLSEDIRNKIIDILKKSDYFKNLTPEKLKDPKTTSELKKIFDSQQETEKLLKELSQSGVFDNSDLEVQKQKLADFLNKMYGYKSQTDDKKPFSAQTFTNDSQFFENLRKAASDHKRFVEQADQAMKNVQEIKKPILKQVDINNVEQVTAELSSGVLVQQVKKLDEAISKLTSSPVEIISNMSDFSKSIIESFLKIAWGNVYNIAQSIWQKFKIPASPQSAVSASSSSSRGFGTPAATSNGKLTTGKNKQASSGTKTNSKKDAKQKGTPRQINQPTVVINLQLNGQVAALAENYVSNLNEIVTTLTSSNELLNKALASVERWTTQKNKKKQKSHSSQRGTISISQMENGTNSSLLDATSNANYNLQSVVNNFGNKQIPNVSGILTNELNVTNITTQSLTKLVEKSHTLQIVNHGDNTVGNKIENLRNYTENEFRVVNNTIGVCLKQIGNLKKGIIDLTPSGGISTAATILHQLHQ